MRADEPEAAAEAEAMAAEGRTVPRHDLDRLFVKGMPFYARHGVYEAERELGQRFVVDCDCRLDTRPAAWADDEALTISYQKIYEQVRAVAEDDPVHLIETLAERIATRLLDHFQLLEEVSVTVHKPNAPVSGIFADVGVEITRRR
ncbi:dihydroneopterin aldolase [Xanthobacter tagetidis]|uniref:7,8-dihydroneopterin aldolase n=1 Tax=Xanthobacter tagetidis TaxID=60216 RepID=A0A3L7AME0_9HYPH|nr:dihydroneopterin aldolase [Xanthobacter tagetidis]MBB6308974.1 dihydroneopterin aldolase [Xanthobacter tagetidis]RLP80638.1 dihydroneopterin aldolase [Xanthobacter tagetidis]